MSPPRRTRLYDLHRRLGARMVDFAGFEMPLQYSSILREHAAVREAAGLFDVSHMGQIGFEGPAAVEAAGQLLSRPVADLRPGRVRYALLCNEAGGVVDDVTVHRLAENALFLCVNAANVEKDLAWIRARVPAGCEVRDTSSETALIALQGPASPELLARAGAPGAAALGRFRFDRMRVAQVETLLARTGYTGADGFEIYCDVGQVEGVFETLLERGEALGALPAGLGARDTLRLEAALPLYGHELDDETSPLEAGLDAFVALDRDFVGAEAIRRRRAEGLAKRLIGFELEGRGVARQGHAVWSDDRAVGVVTSGGPSPTLGKSIGLAYVPPVLAEQGVRLDIRIRDRATPARVVPTPFVRGERAGRPPGRG
jgi:aminomethyltransferase